MTSALFLRVILSMSEAGPPSMSISIFLVLYIFMTLSYAAASLFTSLIPSASSVPVAPPKEIRTIPPLVWTIFAWST
ncbi:hypothetical protein PBCV1_a183L [Paramecium bursaria Chlorella virus 1]|uniref:Uncharacterized protein n=1 Tax=Paramecium bursaria Chlorella virus 1 TaxID=10506 RepID=Q84503_PBCV1|nr:hypothetical protein PBCV1_a183L [Paramecium bursaria Chlorella virus 1]AAC96551.1 hypothetical protein [Paramecium bursaria Chlorella virus 1]